MKSNFNQHNVWAHVGKVQKINMLQFGQIPPLPILNKTYFGNKNKIKFLLFLGFFSTSQSFKCCKKVFSKALKCIWLMRVQLRVIRRWLMVTLWAIWPQCNASLPKHATRTVKCSKALQKHPGSNKSPKKAANHFFFIYFLMHLSALRPNPVSASAQGGRAGPSATGSVHAGF